MEILITNRHIFPEQIDRLLNALYSVHFFEKSMLVGSWLMPIYQELFGVAYPLRTLDIDFAVELACKGDVPRIDLEKIIISLGYLPSISQSGVQKFSRENFTVEFISHRKGGREEAAVLVSNWNITTCPLPFVDILLRFPFIADFGDYKVRVPLPEAFFVHKLIIAQRRLSKEKRLKDLEQCSVIARSFEFDRLKEVVDTLRLSKAVQKAIRTSCETIDFPPQKLGLQ